MKKLLKYLLRTLLCLLVLLLVLPLAIYIPAVQRWGKNEIIDYVHESMGMQLDIESLSIGFPFKLQLNNTLLLTAEQDTMLKSKQVQVNIKPLLLFTGKVKAPKIILKDTYLNFTNADSTMQVSANVHILSTRKTNIRLLKNRIELPDVRLDGADIAVNILKESPPDTIPSEDNPTNWRIDLKKLKLVDVHYSMSTPTIQELDASIEQATLRHGDIDLYSQSVLLDETTIKQGKFRYIPAIPNPGDTLALQEVAVEVDTLPSISWTIQINKIRLEQNRVLYAQPHHSPQKGLDPSYISLYNIDLAIDSLYNCGETMEIPLKELTFIERSGFRVTHSEANFSMDSTGISLQQFKMNTPYSRLSAEASLGIGIPAQSPVHAKLSARLGMTDLVTLFPHYASYTQGTPLSTQLKSEVSVTGNFNDLRLSNGKIELPGTLTTQLNGRMQHFSNPHKRKGNIQWEGQITNSPFIAQLLNDTTHQVHIPDTHITGNVAIEKDTVKAQSLILAEQGNIDLNARLNLNRKRYRCNLAINQFPLAGYLPHSSLGIVTASARISGRGYNPTDSTSRASVKLAIDALDYLGYRYSGLTTQVQLKRGNLSGSISGTDTHLKMAFNLSGKLMPEYYTANINGNLHTDLKALNLATEECSVSTTIDLSGNVTPAQSGYALDLKLTNFLGQLPSSDLRTSLFSLTAETDTAHIQGRIRNGDFAVNFDSELGLDDFMKKINQTLPVLDSATVKRRIDITALHQTLPPFKFSSSAKKNNLLQQYLNGTEMSFTQFNFNLSNDSALNIDGEANRFSSGDVIIDTIRLGAFERKERENRLYYTLQIGNRPGNLDQLASLTLNGFLSGNGTRLFCVQKNSKGETGIRIGCQADFLDDLLQLSLFPKKPIIGFETWDLNEDNFFAYHYNHHFDADISLIHGDKHLIVATQHLHEEHDLSHQEALMVDIKGMEIAPWLNLSPFAPQITGSISADMQIGFPVNGFNVDGDLGFNNFYYGKKRVGDFNLNVNYYLDSLNRHIAQASLAVDNAQALTFNGTVDNQSQNAIDANIALNQFPLQIFNPFLPATTLQLQGTINGEMALSEISDTPQLNGSIQMDNASVTSKSMGANLKFSQESIPIANNMLRLNNYSLIGANKRPLLINGVVDFRNLEQITADLTLRAREFQPIKSNKSSKATLYGSAMTDLDLTVKGPLDALKIRGNIDLITGTDATYVMQDSPFALQQQKNNLVTFVSFNDSTKNKKKVEVDTIPPRKLSGMDILVNINIAPTVKMGVNLSVDGKNRIDLQGGGQLTYTMTPLGNSRFSGRYDLNGGFVRYNPPIISEKLFVIKDGSYVTWNGDIGSPYLNITGIETTRTTISEENKNPRQVDFDISIIIKNTLRNLSVAFDLAAPKDLTLQNQLSSLTNEQRSAQAMSLLIYNTYTGPGTSTKNELVGNPLNSFIEKELNKWAQDNLKGIDLSFGINSYTDESGINTRTDYSYRAAKSLWNNRIKVVIGGSLSPDDDVDVNFKENFIDDLSLEYYLNQRDNMYLKVFRHTGYESILEGEITQMGVGFVLKKRLLKLSDLFRFRRNKKEIKP